jgi:transposase
MRGRKERPMSRKWRKHSPEFKLEAVRLAESNGKSVADVARELGVRAEMIHRWQREIAAKKAANGSGPAGKLTSQDEEIRRLRQELKVVRDERDILKKATAFFARASQ